MINRDLVKTILTFVGIENVKIRCEQPQAKLFIEFDRYGKHEHIELSCEQISQTFSDAVSANEDRL